MHSPPLQLLPVSTDHYWVSGDVAIAPGAAIAPGVLLQADPDSQIVIGVGVCIGMGSILHASGGRLTIGDGAMIGAGVLIVGAIGIGDRVCIGSATTISNRSVGSGTLIPPGSLLCAESAPSPQPESAADPWEEQASEPSLAHNGQPSDMFSQNGTPPPTSDLSSPEPVLKEPPQADASELPDNHNLGNRDAAIVQKSNLQPGVYGQVYVNQLLGKLIPNRNSNP